MRLSELRPCDGCGGEVAPIFVTVHASRHMLDAVAVNQTLGLHQIMGGEAMGAFGLLVAEVMSPHDSVTVTLDEKSFMLCQACFIERLGALYFQEEDDDDESDGGAIDAGG